MNMSVVVKLTCTKTNIKKKTRTCPSCAGIQYFARPTRRQQLTTFFHSLAVEECLTLDKTLRSSLSLSSQPANHSGGGAGLPTVLRLNNNGEVNIACH